MGLLGLSSFLNDYKERFQRFKSYIDNIHNQTIENQTHKGYLVN